jgi:hypothetical protein
LRRYKHLRGRTKIPGAKQGSLAQSRDPGRNAKFCAAKQRSPRRRNLLRAKAKFCEGTQGSPGRRKVLRGDARFSTPKQPSLEQNKDPERKARFCGAREVDIATQTFPPRFWSRSRNPATFLPAGPYTLPEGSCRCSSGFIDNLQGWRPPGPRTPPSRA